MISGPHTSTRAPVQQSLPKSPVGDAVRYLTNQWAALQRFVSGRTQRLVLFTECGV